MNIINALKYDIPPTGGLGIRLERVAMFMSLTENIKDVILVPLTS